MAKTITMFEHETIKCRLTDGEIKGLRRLKAKLDFEPLRVTRLDDGGCEIHSSQYVGVIRVAGRNIQILPKIHRREESTPERAATRNLLYMLDVAKNISLREQDLAPLLERDLDWFEVLTRLFASHLMEEWQRGAIKDYTRYEGDLAVLKGKWLMTDQARRPARMHVFSVAFDEFTADNTLNRVLRYVVERLWRATRDGDNRRMLAVLRQWMDEVSLQPMMTVEDVDQALINRLNRRYDPLLALCRLFLDGRTLQLAAGDMDTFSLLFDMNLLFEQFIAEFIRRHRQYILPEGWQQFTLHPQARGLPHYLAIQDNKRVFQLIPDLAIRDLQGCFPLLMDTKYKLLNEDEARLGISPADMYQMFAYAHRYYCPRVVLVYPRTVGMNDGVRATFTLEDDGKTIDARTVDLCLDLARDKDLLKSELKSIIQGES